MRNARLSPLAIALAFTVALAGCAGGDDGNGGGAPGPGPDPGPPARVFLPLEFPFANPSAIVRMASWGIPNWSGTEPHNGMDFEVNGRLALTPIVSPTAGEVVSISSSENPYSHPPGQLMVTVSIRVNPEWTVSLVFEPSTSDPGLKAAQLAAIRVREGQVVAVGTPVADLLVGTLGYPHLHYMIWRNNADVCGYAHSSEGAKRIIETVARYPRSNVPGGRICVGQP
ncbi:MAG: M23 family metallopeptidase [Deltaproteobacteria bacterium]|nr:M23 family metallopeptidase [Deltaproteobacteria bacterium]